MQKKSNAVFKHVNGKRAVSVLIALSLALTQLAIAASGTELSGRKVKTASNAIADADRALDRLDGQVPKHSKLLPRGTIGSSTVEVMCGKGEASVSIQIERDEHGRVDPRALVEGVESLDCGSIESEL